MSTDAKREGWELAMAVSITAICLYSSAVIVDAAESYREPEPVSVCGRYDRCPETTHAN